MADNSKSNGVGFLALLGLLFVGLKLGKVIAWSWLWVLSPFILKAVLWVAAVALLTYEGVQIRLAREKLRREQPPLQERDFGVDFLGKSD